jgi:hypothetical protein
MITIPIGIIPTEIMRIQVMEPVVIVPVLISWIKRLIRAAWIAVHVHSPFIVSSFSDYAMLPPN